MNTHQLHGMRRQPRDKTPTSSLQLLVSPGSKGLEKHDENCRKALLRGRTHFLGTSVAASGKGLNTYLAEDQEAMFKTVLPLDILPEK